MIDTAGIIPAAEPEVPVHTHPSGVVFGAACKVPGCGWQLVDEFKAYVEAEAQHHLHQHVAAHASQLVRQCVACQGAAR
jgi:hypothetical protein